MASDIETERKFALGRGEELPGLDDIVNVGPAVALELVFTYYDTYDFRLNAAGQVVQRRRGGPDAGWHAKLPTEDPDTRREIALPPGGERLPRQLRDLVADSAAGHALYPVADVHISRSQRELCDESGRLLAWQFTDRMRARVAGKSQEWTEAEIELVEGDVALLDRVETALAAQGVLRSTSPSKLSRALAEQPTSANEEPAAPQSWAVVRSYLSAQIGLLQSQEPALLSDSLDAVHRCRVATRRLRCVLHSFAGLFRTGAIRALREELRWYAECLGAPRDAEVLLARLSLAMDELAAAVDADVRERIRGDLTRAHREAHQDLIAALASERYLRLQLALERLLAEPPLDWRASEPASILLPGMYDAVVAVARQRTERAMARPGDLTRWHEVRKAAKAARYSAELMTLAVGEPAARAAELWARASGALGEVQDAVIADQVIGDLSHAAVTEGLERGPFDELRHHQDGRRREALDRGRAALAAALG
jgi:CHAD domain-containing protein